MPTNGEIINPNENIKIPKWLTADFFKAIVKKAEPDFVQILKFTPIAAIPPGENFTSIMIRIHVDLELKNGTQKHKTYILKTTLDFDKGGEFMEQLCLFPKEMAMYNKYLPAFEAYYKAAGKDVQIAPKCFYTEKIEGQYVFIFEDLQIKSFENANRLEGLDMAHMRLVLEKLAQFHAASAVYVEEHGQLPNEFQFGFMNNNGDPGFHKFAYALREQAYKKALAEWNLEDADKYIQKFPTFDQYWQAGMRTLQINPNAFNVLNHGDFWTSNIMFSKNSAGQVQNLLLLDFQICKWGSPAEDLLFFITTSAAKDIRIKEYDHFVQIYHEHLVESLKLLKYKKPIPKLRDLQMSMYKKDSTFMAFFVVFNHLLLICLPSDKDSSADNFMRNDEVGEKFREKAFKNPRFVDAAKDWFTFYHRRGIFNFDDFQE